MKSIRILRQILGISQETLCAETGLSRQSLSAFESGAAFPARSTARTLDNGLEAIIDRRALAAAQTLREEKQPAMGR